jgi:hypothetical protein
MMGSAKVRVQTVMAGTLGGVDNIPALPRVSCCRTYFFIKWARKSIHQELIMKRILTLAVTAILASAMAFAQEASSSTPAAGSDQQAASTATNKKAKKTHAKKHGKKAKSTKTSATSTSESTPK